ncbi:hypothetical protein BKA83DRAFT_4243894, partial [Pisolithus microcarpus]
MPTAESTTIEEGSVEGSLPDQEQTSPEPHPHVTRPMFLPSSHLGQPNDQRYAVANQLAHYFSRRSAGMHDATSCVHASGRTHINTETPTPSSAGPSVATTRVGSPGTDRKASLRAYTMSSDHSEPRQPTDVEAEPGADKLHEPGDPESIPPHISILHPIPGLHANLYEYQRTPYRHSHCGQLDRPNTAEYEIVSIIRNMPLLVIAWVCTGVGGAGMIGLWWKWRRNYIWIVSRVFVPGLLNSVAGIIATVTNAYETQGNL